MNKIVVITGPSAGIGAATAELLGKRGMKLGLMARRADAMRAVADQCDAAYYASLGVDAAGSR